MKPRPGMCTHDIAGEAVSGDLQRSQQDYLCSHSRRRLTRAHTTREAAGRRVFSGRSPQDILECVPETGADGTVRLPAATPVVRRHHGFPGRAFGGVEALLDDPQVERVLGRGREYGQWRCVLCDKEP